MLGIPRPGRRDRFQDVGGDSLAAINLAITLERQFGVAVSLDRIAAAQTIEAIVAALQGVGAERRCGLVSMRSDGEGPVLVFFPGVGGHAWVFTTLCQFLDTPCDAIAVSFSDLDAQRRGAFRPALRAAVAEALAEFPADRSVVLVGYSFGAAPAVDVAGWLLSRGAPVREIVMIDPSPIDAAPPRTTLRGLLSAAHRMLRPARTPSSPAAAELERSVARVTRVLQREYLDGTLRAPSVACSWLMSDEMHAKYGAAPAAFGRRVAEHDRRRVNCAHLELLRLPGAVETARWLDSRLAQAAPQPAVSAG